MDTGGGVTPNWTRALLITVAAVAILLGATAIIFLPDVLYPMSVTVDTAKLTEKEKLDALNGMLQQRSSLRAMLLQGFAGLAVASGAVLAWRQFIHTRREALLQQQEKQEAFYSTYSAKQ